MSVENDSESSSTSSDEEYLPEVDEEFEKSFLKTLSSLKKNDPSIYDKDKKFFDESTALLPVKSKKKSGKDENKPLFIKDYERKVLIENEGYDDEIEYQPKPNNDLPYVEEQRRLKDSFKSFLNESDEEDDSLLKPSVKTEKETEQEEADYIQWLKGQKQELEDKSTEKNLENLKEYWNSDQLDKDEAFLRDYVLNKQFLDNDESDEDNEALSEDSESFEAQEDFEQKYNFRYETGDNLVRRFPRNIEDSLRRKDNKRSKKRSEVKERKGIEKKKKREEINRQKKLKVKEISERLEKLKELTGNEKLAFNDDDILDDFDPEDHDKKMAAMYNDDFYNQGDQDKPEFDLLDVGNIEEDYENANYQEQELEGERKRRKDKKTRTKRKKERRKAFSDLSFIDKPTFNPELHQSFQKYMDEYYELDCEDFIDDIPCRFKYKQVEPNDYGLTVEEILAADDSELNRWSSIKKIYKIRAPHVERNEAKIYKFKGQDESLKMKILPSLYKSEEDVKAVDESHIEEDQNAQSISKMKKKKKSKSKPSEQDYHENDSTTLVEPSAILNPSPEPYSSGVIEDKQTKRKRKQNLTPQDINLTENEETPAKILKVSEGSTSQNNISHELNVDNQRSKSFKSLKNSPHYKNKKNYKSRYNKNHNFHDSRLSAYGINPKKFKLKG